MRDRCAAGMLLAALAIAGMAMPEAQGAPLTIVFVKRQESPVRGGTTLRIRLNGNGRRLLIALREPGSPGASDALVRLQGLEVPFRSSCAGPPGATCEVTLLQDTGTPPPLGADGVPVVDPNRQITETGGGRIPRRGRRAVRTRFNDRGKALLAGAPAGELKAVELTVIRPRPGSTDRATASTVPATIALPGL